VRVLGAADEATEKMRSYKSGRSGVLRLGFVDSASYDVLPRFLSHYAAEYPEVDYELRTLSSDEQHQALIDREIDLGIARAVRAGSGLTATPFVDEPLLVAVSDSNALASRKTMWLRELTRERLIGFDRGVSPSLFSELAQLFGAADVDYDPIIEATEYATVLGLVASGQGLAVVPASVQSFRPPGLTYVRLRDARARSSLMLLNREDETSLLIAHATDVVSQLFGSRTSNS
ncbi:MAG: LysR family substrate-binding domain-containing protein, partial [Acidimicrobiales bacterium]